MRTIFSDSGILFTIGNTRFQVLNAIYEKFYRTIPSHSHGSGSYEIHYISEGYGWARIDGRFYDIVPQTLYVTGPHVEHAQTPRTENPMCEYCIYLKTEKLPRSHAAYTALSADTGQVLSLFENTPFWFGKGNDKLRLLMETLFEEFSLRRTGYQLQIQALMHQLLVLLARNYENQESKASTPSRQSPENKAAVIIEDYFLYEYNHLSLEELADKLGLGTRQTERLLQKLYGKTFLQKKAEARMSAAALLLALPARNITSIAEELGYSSVEHFSTAFRNYYHMSPREYRKKEAPAH